jgi:ABC-type branched-subunit amino acid transport system ATPase component
MERFAKFSANSSPARYGELFEHRACDAHAGCKHCRRSVSALMMRHDLLMLDEPTLGLAPIVRQQLSDSWALAQDRRQLPCFLQNRTSRLRPRSS